MIKAPLVKLEKNRRSEVLFWVLNGLIFFILWFILFPSMPTSLSPSLYRSPQMVLCCVHHYDRRQDVHPLRHGRQKGPWATETRPRGQLLRPVAEIRRNRVVPRLQGHKDTEVTPLHRVQCVCGALRPPLLLDQQLCRRKQPQQLSVLRDLRLVDGTPSDVHRYGW
jgi:hypothetical protein